MIGFAGGIATVKATAHEIIAKGYLEKYPSSESSEQGKDSV
jgi:hypothetical protein